MPTRRDSRRRGNTATLSSNRLIWCCCSSSMLCTVCGLAWHRLAWPGLAWPGLACSDRTGAGWRNGWGKGREYLSRQRSARCCPASAAWRRIGLVAALSCHLFPPFPSRTVRLAPHTSRPAHQRPRDLATSRPRASRLTPCNLAPLRPCAPVCFPHLLACLPSPYVHRPALRARPSSACSRPQSLPDCDANATDGLPEGQRAATFAARERGGPRRPDEGNRASRPRISQRARRQFARVPQSVSAGRSSKLYCAVQLRLRSGCDTSICASAGVR